MAHHSDLDRHPDWEKWNALVAKQLKGNVPEDLSWHSPEGITVQPLYTAEDMASLAHTNTLPGFAPYIRGPMATMYTGTTLDHPAVCRFFNRPGVQCLLPPQPGRRSEGAFGGL